ncbi:unnamed protein product [Linum trigynum]|uniref:Reverse transcriptase zinc-binding domain n=1 Tax=Linum trigynum TaxID=586398 RepID=A0AAV2DNI5_9ROSI
MFSVKTAYHAFHKENTNFQPTGSADKWKWMWGLNLPPKLKFFIWRCSRNGLATKARLFHRKCAPNPTCQVCNNPNESLLHCLLYCPHANEAWSSIFPSLPLPPQDSAFFDWIWDIKDAISHEALIHIVFLCWNIWKARNERTFKNRVLWPPNVCLQTFRERTEWSSIPRPPSTNDASPTQLRGTHTSTNPPPSNHPLMIHCDGSFISDSQPATYGVVTSNHHGQVSDGRAETFLCSTPIEAEAKAHLEGIKLAQEYGTECTVFSDCQDLVKALEKDYSGWPWRCAAGIGLMINILRNNPFIKVNQVPRALNVRADWVARSKARSTLPVNWISILDLKSDLL